MNGEAIVQRLRWRCRRGTRELDALFGDWLERCYPGADAAARQAFAERRDHEFLFFLNRPANGVVALALRTDTAPEVLAAEAKGLAPGPYRLRWQVLAVDGHITRGDIPFTVVAP